MWRWVGPIRVRVRVKVKVSLVWGSDHPGSMDELVTVAQLPEEQHPETQDHHREDLDMLHRGSMMCT